VAGNGRSALSRLIAQKIYQPSEVIVSEPQQQRRSVLSSIWCQVTADNRVVALETSVILLAVKPQLFEVIAAELADVVATPAVESLPLVISILAGVPLSKLEAAFPQLPVRQCPYSGKAGITCHFLRFSYPESHQNTAQKLFSAVGEVVKYQKR